MDGLEAVRAEYDRLDRMLGIDTSGILLSCSARMVRQYGVCCFCGDSPTNIRLAAFLLDEPEQLNKAPYDAWLIKVENITDTEELLDAAAYEAFCAEEG